jgi:hypothetical protein
MFLFLLIAVLPAILYATELSEVLSPSELAGIKFEAVVYKASPSKSFENISLLWYAPNNPADLCSEATMAVQATNNNQALIFSGSDELRCLPEKVAQVAMAKGFAAIIWRDFYARPGYIASSVWASNTAPIPIYDVIFSSAFQFNVTTSVKLIPMENPYSGGHWFAPQIPLRILLVSLYLIELVICVRALASQLRTIQTPKELSTAHGILMFGICGAVVEILFNIDFMGQSHIFPLPLWAGLYTWGYVLNFLNTFLIAKSILAAEATVRGLRFARSHNILLNIAFGLLVLVNAIATILLGWVVYYNSAMTSLLSLLFLLFQSVVGIHFLFTQTRVLKILKENAKNRGDAVETVKNLQRMSFFMYISGFFMLAFCVVSLAPAISLSSVQTLVMSTAAASIFNALTALAQILSLPQKVTGIDYSRLMRRFNGGQVVLSRSSHTRAKSNTPSQAMPNSGDQQSPIPNGASVTETV